MKHSLPDHSALSTSEAACPTAAALQATHGANPEGFPGIGTVGYGQDAVHGCGIISNKCAQPG